MKKTVGDLTARDLVEGTPITLDGFTGALEALELHHRPGGPHLSVAWANHRWSACPLDTPVVVHDLSGKAELAERFAHQEETRAGAIREIMLELPRRTIQTYQELDLPPYERTPLTLELIPDEVLPTFQELVRIRRNALGLLPSEALPYEELVEIRRTAQEAHDD